MTKKQIKVMIVLALTVVVFTITVFLIPFHKGSVFWIAYIAELIAVALQIPVFKLAYDKASDLKSSILGFPVFRVGYTYFAIQTVVSIILFAVGGLITSFPAWIAFVLCLMVFAGGIICSITVDIARDEIVSIESSENVNTRLIKSLRLQAVNLVHRTDDAELRKRMEKLADDLRYSDPVSSKKIVEYERILCRYFEQLEDSVKNGDVQRALSCCEDVSIALLERNMACKLNK